METTGGLYSNENFRFVILKSVLCAVGGNDGDSVTLVVYDEGSDKWELDASFPFTPNGVNGGIDHLQHFRKEVSVNPLLGRAFHIALHLDHQF